MGWMKKTNMFQIASWLVPQMLSKIRFLFTLALYHMMIESYNIHYPDDFR